MDTSLGLSGSMVGLMVGFLCSILIFLFSGLGAGDVKFITSIGAIVGSQSILLITAYSYIASTFLIICYLIIRLIGQLTKNLQNTNTKSYLSKRIPMAPGISIATLYVIYNHHF